MTNNLKTTKSTVYYQSCRDTDEQTSDSLQKKKIEMDD